MTSRRVKGGETLFLASGDEWILLGGQKREKGNQDKICFERQGGGNTLQLGGRFRITLLSGGGSLGRLLGRVFVLGRGKKFSGEDSLFDIKRGNRLGGRGRRGSASRIRRRLSKNNRGEDIYSRGTQYQGGASPEKEWGSPTPIC